jgi:hypothetical protein
MLLTFESVKGYPILAITRHADKGLKVLDTAPSPLPRRHWLRTPSTVSCDHHHFEVSLPTS